MTDLSVIAIIASIILVGIAGIGIQITISLYILRRMDERLDAMQKEISELKERVARLEGIIIGRLEFGNGALTQSGDD